MDGTGERRVLQAAGAQAPGVGRQFYRGSDGRLSALDSQTVAVIGYGNLGRSVALNLRDSGLQVVVGNQPDRYADTAHDDGFDVVGVNEAIAKADVVWMLLPDEVISSALGSSGGPGTGLRPGTLVCFSAGYALAFGQVDLGAAEVDVAMFAPRMVGSEVRTRYQRDEGFTAYISVEKDLSGTAWERLLALGRAAGTVHLKAMVLSAAEEAVLDLYVEQTLGPVLGMALLAAFEVGTEAGLSPEALALELYLSGEMARTWQAFADEGFYRAVRLHGRTAAFGGFIHAGDIDKRALCEGFAKTLEDIRSGGFAQRFQKERSDDYPTFELIDAMTAGHDPLSAAEARVRAALDSLPISSAV